MQLKMLPGGLSVCRLPSTDGIDLSAGFYFIGRTDEEISLVCRTEYVPENTEKREDGWRAFRIEGTLDFSLVGILSACGRTKRTNGRSGRWKQRDTGSFRNGIPRRRGILPTVE